MTTSTVHGSTLMPCLRYRNPLAAIDFLCRAFGFTRHAVYENDRGGVNHAQLTYGNGMLMLGEVRDDAYGRRIIQPSDTAGRVTQSVYVSVIDCKAHYRQAKMAGADIVDDYEEKDYGGAGYSCRDPEGHHWSFGDYDPWQTA